MWVPKHRADTQVRPYGDRTRDLPSLTFSAPRVYNGCVSRHRKEVTRETNFFDDSGLRYVLPDRVRHQRLHV